MVAADKKTSKKRKDAQRPWAGMRKPIESLTRLEALERDNRILSEAVDSLRELATEQGRRLSELAARLERLEVRSQIIYPPDPAPAPGSGSRANGPIDPPGPVWGA